MCFRDEDYECDVGRRDPDCRCNKRGTECCDDSSSCDDGTCCERCRSKRDRDCDLCDEDGENCMKLEEVRMSLNYACHQ